MKRSVPAIVMFAWLIVCLGCHNPAKEAVTVAQIAEALLEQKNMPYEFAFSSRTSEGVEGEQTFDLFEVKGIMVHPRPWVGCKLAEFSYGYSGMGLVFQKQAKGLIHTLKEGWFGESYEWECRSSGGSSSILGGIGIYSHGGWSLSSQAGSLIRDFPPTREETLDSGPVLYWDLIPSELAKALQGQFKIVGFDEDFEVIALSLGIDHDLLSPVFFELELKSGRIIRNEYSEYALMQGSYYSRRKELKSEIRVPDSIRCWCDGEIYNVQLELPGRYIR